MAVLLLFGLSSCSSGDEETKPTAKKPAAEKAGNIQTVTFQEPDDRGPDPFTEPAELRGRKTVRVSSSRGSREGSGSGGGSSGSDGNQPFGGSGSNRVCDRNKLLRFLRRNPVKMRAWARALGVSPRYRAVKKYIAKLHPVTLTRDTRITNHAFRDGRAVPFQAILKAGTAVLVDRRGTPVVRCFCGNPLKPAVLMNTAQCVGCPPNYKPPAQCRYGRTEDYQEIRYRRRYYSNADYDEVFIRQQRRGPYTDCYTAYPDPPVVTFVNVYRRPKPRPRPKPPPAPEPQQQSASQAQPTPSQPAAPASAPPPPEPSGLQCNPARSQAEAEQCCQLRGGCQPVPTPEPTPAPPPEPAPEPIPEPPPQPAATPPPPPAPAPPATGVCNDGLDNEGVAGLVDGADPNCQGGAP